MVENRPGAASNIGTEAVAKAPPDGYTLLLTSSANFINATFYDRLNFSFIRDIAPVAGLIRVPNVLEPAEMIDSLNKEITADFAEPNIRARLADLGGMVAAGSPRRPPKAHSRRD